MSKKVKVIIIILIVLVVLFGAVSFVRGGLRSTISADDYETYTVEKGDLSLTAVGSGNISSAKTTYFTPENIIDEIQVVVGDYVAVDDVLAVYKNDDTLVSDVAGVVVIVPGMAGETFAVSSEDELEMTINVTEKDITKMESGLEAEIYIEAFDEYLSGEVVNYSRVGTFQGTYTSYSVTVSVDPASYDVLLGMSGSAKVTVETKSDVYKAPVESLIYEDGETYVLSSQWLENIEENAEDYYIPVITGISDVDFVEIDGNLDDVEILIIPEESDTGFFGIGRQASSNDNT